MFFTNVDNLMPGLQNLWRAVRRFLLSEETLPRLLISKAVTVVLICVMSVTKCAYLFDLSAFHLGNVHIKRHCDLKYVELVVHFVPDGDVRFEVGHSDFWRNSASTRCLISFDVTEYCVL